MNYHITLPAKDLTAPPVTRAQALPGVAEPEYRQDKQELELERENALRQDWQSMSDLERYDAFKSLRSEGCNLARLIATFVSVVELPINEQISYNHSCEIINPPETHK